MSRNDIYFSCDYLNRDEPQTDKKGDIIKTLIYALKQNPGVAALYVCIVGGVSSDASLHMFCDLPTSSYYKASFTGELCEFNADRFYEECQARGLSQRKAAALFNISKGSIQDIFMHRTRRKRRSFVEHCEKILQLEHGSLLL